MEAEKNLRVGGSNLGSGQKAMTVKEAGKRGGLTTLAKHGASHFRRAGAIGGKATAIRHRNKLKEWVSNGNNSKVSVESSTDNNNAQCLGADEYLGDERPNITAESQLTNLTIRVTAQQKAGRKGGLSTVNRYGRAHMSYIGSLGGRPTFEEGLVHARNTRVERSDRANKKRRYWGTALALSLLPMGVMTRQLILAKGT